MALQLSFAAAALLVRLMACRACPRQLLDDALLEGVCALAAHHTMCNLAAFHCATARAAHRPQLQLE